MRYWVSNCDNTHMCVGSTVGPNIFVKFVDIPTTNFKELKTNYLIILIIKKLKLINCVGGGSSFTDFGGVY